MLVPIWIPTDAGSAARPNLAALIVTISIPKDAGSAARQDLVALMAPIWIPMDAHSVVRPNLAANTMVSISIPTDASNAASFRIGVPAVLRISIHSVECAVPHGNTRDDNINPVLLPVNQSENRMERERIFYLIIIKITSIHDAVNSIKNTNVSVIYFRIKNSFYTLI